jgi:hypothetical protein
VTRRAKTRAIAFAEAAIRSVELIVQPGAQAEARSTSLLEQVVQADPEDIPVKPCRRRNGLETEWNSAAANSGDRICRVIQMAEV